MNSIAGPVGSKVSGGGWFGGQSKDGFENESMAVGVGDFSTKSLANVVSQSTKNSTRNIPELRNA